MKAHCIRLPIALEGVPVDYGSCDWECHNAQLREGSAAALNSIAQLR